MKVCKYLVVCLALVLLFASQVSAVKLGTHFFYWYDAPNNNVDQSKMPYHPAGLSSPYNGTYYSSLSTPWYQWQLNDAKAAGIDYIFPVSWGERYQANYFKQSVLTRLVDAVRTNGSPIKIGFYDDTQSEACEWNADNGRGYINSTTDPNLQLSCAAPNAAWYFYDSKIKPFYQMIPRDLWATHNGLPVANGGRPIILTFTSYYYKDLNSAANLWQTVKNSFYNDFGVYPWLCLCWSWHYYSNAGSVADGEVVYGGAYAGCINYTTPNGYKTSNLGPGCDTRLIGRTDYRPRWTDADGYNDLLEDQFLRDNFHQIPADTHLVVLESWNELWEGTAISRCTDYPQRVSGTLSETYYMDKTRDQIRWLRDQTSAPSSLQNGAFESGFTSGIGNSWTPYWVYGDVTFADETTYKHAGSHAQKILSSWWTHLAGMYQRISVTQGQSYTFSAWTWRHDSWNNGSANEETWVGIDPTGGVDPTSSNIIWSSTAYSYHAWTQQSVTATASSNRITVFLRARANYGGQDMRAVFDDAALALAPPPPSEKVNNGTMEGGFFSTGWGSNCSGVTSKLPNPSGTWGWNNEASYPFNTFDATSVKHAGSHSLGFSFCQTAAAPGKLGISFQSVNLGSAGASATFRVWAYHTDGNCPSIMCWNPGAGQANPYTANSAGRFQWVTTDNWGQRNTWVTRTMTVTADSSGYVTIMVGGAAHPGTASGARLYIDDVSVQ